MPEEFAIGAELTPTMKLKRRVIESKYAAEIDAMYGEPPPTATAPGATR